MNAGKMRYVVVLKKRGDEPLRSRIKFETDGKIK